MKIKNVAALQNTLEQMETQQLDDMLLKELRKDAPNGELIRLIGRVLKERDMIPKIDATIQKAWERYQKKTQPVHKKPKIISSFLIKAASMLLVLFALVAMLPQESKAMNFFERFVAWTEDVFSFISPAEANEHKEEYVFWTDNPGLQEVYDKVVELGVTVPVVPMWLPAGYELVECEVENTIAKTYITATFSNGNTDIVYQVDIYADNVTYEYYKDFTSMKTEEKNGIQHTIMCNNDMLVAVWKVENIECSIGIDCQEDVMSRILESIYTMEE